MARPELDDAALHSSHPALTHIALGLGSTHDLFPPTFQDQARSAAELEALRRRVRDAGGHVGAVWALGLEADDGPRGIRPVESEAYIAVPEHLIPPGVDQDDEQLPSAQHPSYPHGNPYAPWTGGPATTLVASSQSRASAPKLDPRLHMHLAVAYHLSSLGGAASSHAGRPSSLSSSSPGPTDRFEAVLQRGPQAAAASSSSSSALAPHLVLRSRAETASNPPVWPFRRFGPGKGGNEALRRAESQRPWKPQREVWADFGLEELQPRGGERDPLRSFREDEAAKRKQMERAFGAERERERERIRERERQRRKEMKRAAAAAANLTTGDESGMPVEQSYIEDSDVVTRDVTGGGGGGGDGGDESLLDESAMRAVALAESIEEEGYSQTGDEYVDDSAMEPSGAQSAVAGRRPDADFSLADWDPDDDLEADDGAANEGRASSFVWGRGRTAANVRDRPATPYSEL